MMRQRDGKLFQERHTRSRVGQLFCARSRGRAIRLVHRRNIQGFEILANRAGGEPIVNGGPHASQ